MSMRQEAIRELARRELARRQGAASGQPQGSGSSPRIIEEQHDAIGIGDRFAVKNFSQSPEASAKYLQEKHPDLDVRPHGDRVLVKDKNASEWKVVDPDTGFFSTDILSDASDILYDVGAGVAEGVGGVAAGIGTMNPLAGLATAGGLGAGAEALRQGIGASMGINDDLGEAAGDTAVVGGLSALIPGLGKLIKPGVQAAAKGAKGMVRGLTQANKDDIDVFVNQKGALDDILESDTGFTDTFTKINQEVAEKEKLFKDELGKQFKQLRQSGVTVDTEAAKDLYDKKLAELSETVGRGAASDSDKALLNSLQKERDSLFSSTNEMRDITSTNSKFNVSETAEPALSTSQRMGSVPTDAPQKSLGGRQSVRDSFKVADDGTSTSDLIRGKDFNRNLRQDIPENMDISDAMNLRQKLAARANFKNKADIQKSLDSADLSESLAARGYGELGTAIDDVASKLGSKEARGQFKDHMEFVGDIAKHFKTPESLESFMKAASKGNRKAVAEKLGRIDKRFGTDIAEKAKVISSAQALKDQGGGAMVDLMRPRSALELLGGAAGAKAAWASGQPWLIPITLTAGAAVGRKFGSVKMARRYVDFIVEAEGKALGLDKKAKELLKEKLYKSVTGADAIRGAVTAGASASRSRE